MTKRTGDQPTSGRSSSPTGSTRTTNRGHQANAAAPPSEIPAAPPADAHTRALLARLPQYQQIAEDLRRQIETGQLAPGAPLPSETEINSRYGVSRITARNAVRALRAAGLVVTEHGRGTYVRPLAAANTLEFDPTITRAGGRYLAWDQHGWMPVEEPARYRTEARGETARQLDLADGEALFVYERLLADETGVRIAHRLYLPFATCLDTPLEADPFCEPAELYQLLADAGHELTWRDRTSARMPTPDDATALTIPEGVPLLIHTRTTLGSERGDGRPLALEQTHLPADRAVTAASITASPPRE